MPPMLRHMFCRAHATHTWPWRYHRDRTSSHPEDASAADLPLPPWWRMVPKRQRNRKIHIPPIVLGWEPPVSWALLGDGPSNNLPPLDKCCCLRRHPVAAEAWPAGPPQRRDFAAATGANQTRRHQGHHWYSQQTKVLFGAAADAGTRAGHCKGRRWSIHTIHAFARRRGGRCGAGPSAPALPTTTRAGGAASPDARRSWSSRPPRSVDLCHTSGACLIDRRDLACWNFGLFGMTYISEKPVNAEWKITGPLQHEKHEKRRRAKRRLVCHLFACPETMPTAEEPSCKEGAGVARRKRVIRTTTTTVVRRGRGAERWWPAVAMVASISHPR